jgi:hypothetical protein
LPVCGERGLHQLADPGDLRGLDLEVRDLAVGALGGRLVDEDPGVLHREATPGVPAASSTAAADAACPRQTVWMSGRMNCIVS